MALEVWKSALNHRRVFLAVDNESARCAMIKAASAAPCLRALCGLIAELDLESPTLRWLVRVPSSSNSADAPSRGDLLRLRRLKAVRHDVSWEELRLGRLDWFD